MPRQKILVVEPTYHDVDHAVVNAGILQGIALALPDTDLIFASTPTHRAGVMEAFLKVPSALAFQDIDVMRPGKTSFCRAWAQWNSIAGHVRRQAPEKIVVLSSGPETFFVCRLLAMAFRTTEIFVVQHGNLTVAVGWRSRDLRHRLFDYRSGLAVAKHSNIRLVVLEDSIRDAASRMGIRAKFLAWPLPLNEAENVVRAPWVPTGPLRLAFVGAATRAKGFGEFLTIARDAQGGAYHFDLAGYRCDKFTPEELGGVTCPDARLPRDSFITQLRRADYAFMAFSDDVYSLTASGSLLDCIAQLKPIVAVESEILRMLAAKYGPIGHLCPTLEHMRRLLADPEKLLDRRSYEGFQDALECIRHDRSPAALANILRDHLSSTLANPGLADRMWVAKPVVG